MNLPEGVSRSLADTIYTRQDASVVQTFLGRIGVEASRTFVEFFEKYAGPFVSESIPYELLDIIEDEPRSIEGLTVAARETHFLPARFLVITDLNAGALLMFDTMTDKVYEVDFEGRYDLLLKGNLNAAWDSFRTFLNEYFL